MKMLRVMGLAFAGLWGGGLIVMHGAAFLLEAWGRDGGLAIGVGLFALTVFTAFLGIYLLFEYDEIVKRVRSVGGETRKESRDE